MGQETYVTLVSDQLSGQLEIRHRVGSSRRRLMLGGTVVADDALAGYCGSRGAG